MTKSINQTVVVHFLTQSLKPQSHTQQADHSFDQHVTTVAYSESFDLPSFLAANRIRISPKSAYVEEHAALPGHVFEALDIELAETWQMGLNIPLPWSLISIELLTLEQLNEVIAKAEAADYQAADDHAVAFEQSFYVNEEAAE